MLEYFILGLIAMQVAIPLIDSIVSVIIKGLSVIQSYFDVILARNGYKVQKISYGQEDEEPIVRHPMGFIREEEDGEDDL